MAPGTYGKTWWRDGYACGCMIQSIEDIIEPRLRAAGKLGASEWVNAFQYAYNSSVGASAGTHSGGGALDHRKGDDAETKIWRECGVADWQRGTPEDTAFDDHNHGIWQGCPHVADDAASQLDQYDAGCNGLSGWGPDQSPHVDPISWQDAYDKYAGDTTPADDEGILGMTELDRQHCSKDRVVKVSDDWWLILINDDGGSTLVEGPCKFTAEAFLQVTGLPPGDDPLRVRFGRYDPKADKISGYYSQEEIFGSGGTTFGRTGLTNWIPDGMRLRLYAQTPHQITVTDVVTSVLYAPDPK